MKKGHILNVEVLHLTQTIERKTYSKFIPNNSNYSIQQNGSYVLKKAPTGHKIPCIKDYW
jgi:hypothetical protein